MRKLRLSIKIKCATIIQRHARGRFGRLKHKRVKHFMTQVWLELSAIYQQHVASITHKINTLDSTPLKDVSPWQLVHLSLAMFCMTGKSELAVSISAYCSKSCSLLSIAAQLVSECTMLASWASFGKAGVMREDLVSSLVL